jgi:hypothetical protein
MNLLSNVSKSLGYPLAELTVATCVLGLFLVERILMVLTGRVTSSRDYFLSSHQTTFVVTKTDNKSEEDKGTRQI